MKTSLEKLEGLKRALTVELSIDIFKQKTDQVLRGMASKVSVDGFRKGKVPLSIMRKQFGGQASSDAVNEIVNDTLTEALADAKVTPASRPAITKIDTENKDTFSYTVTFEVFPEIKVADFSKLKIVQTEVKITKADEEKTLKGLSEQATEYKSVKRKSKEGDQVTIDFKGMLDGEVFEGGVASDFKMVLGKGSMIAGFEDGLLDVAAEKSVTLNLTFPKEYHAPQLAGKDVVFEVEIKEVAAPQSPKLDDEFAKRFGEKDIDDLKKSMKAQMQVELDNRLNNQNKDDLFGALLEANDFEVPQESINNEAQSLKQEMEQRLQQQGMPSQGNMPASAFNPEAQRRVKLGLLVDQISSDNKFNASKEQIDTKLNEMATAYSGEAQQMLDYYNAEPSRLATIELMVVEQMVQDLILESAKVTIQKKTFEEVTQQ
ncbi:Cell division trigger factor (EC [uncultured Gammaproteobacteria bacterium]|jgi:trigger factor|uniref:trigger factor n=1 Tax=thiotrophic endosymbiont of Bathymodiolus puteoserpentis (Logatchev) TaxID=343240 RepID=UPI0010AFCA18|nr:trigger factor [thiotrophic endosymbiont of Bathymodiolus puteoserpentis (Logatchev)]CAC9576792.1 Cell division trigger factor (EC 5.2.1.8) [uncultured Gammaproteobacteria bacterium]SSC10914.1 Cell division trigger factor [thiotrophic endosymbiont of Bathymodiolus puteoserpentis (Logatchev)]VVH51984.1 Cell division trigger factor (EC [uncultured Gammaproteobacteria bacterium]